MDSNDMKRRDTQLKWNIYDLCNVHAHGHNAQVKNKRPEHYTYISDFLNANNIVFVLES